MKAKIGPTLGHETSTSTLMNLNNFNIILYYTNIFK